jgi:hypothetical protein
LKQLARILAAVALALASGCGYTVRVRNDNEHAITARLIQVDAFMKDWVSAVEKIDPGQTVVLGPVRTMASYIMLETIPTAGEPIGPAKRAVLPGNHAFRIGVEEDEKGRRLMLQTAAWRDLGP